MLCCNKSTYGIFAVALVPQGLLDCALRPINEAFGIAAFRIYVREKFMTIRKTLSVIMATLVLSATFATAADAATRRSTASTRTQAARAKASKARPAARPVRSTAAQQRDGGSAQTDTLNEQSLNAARGGVTQ